MKFLLIWLCLFSSLCATAQQNFTSTADSLLQQKNYFVANLMAEEILFNNSNSTEVDEAVSIKIQTYKAQKNYKQLYDFIATCYQLNTSDSFKNILLYEEALSAYLTNRYAQAVNLFKFCKTTKQQQIFIDALIIVCYNHQQYWDTAKILYKNFCEKYATDSNEVVKLYSLKPNLKNARKAKILSTFLPGTGQMYAGKTGEGIINLLLQSTCIYTSFLWWSLNYKWATVLLSGNFWNSFYDGGKRRATHLVEEYNRKKIKEYNQALNRLILNQVKAIDL